MQSTNLEKPIEFWWPSPEALDVLSVEDTEEGFTLVAPDDTECGEWLAFWSQTEEHHELFEREFTKSLLDYLDKLDGKTEIVADQQSSN
jgi:hypothetical protein